MPKILIIDDNYIHSEVLKAILEDEGHMVITNALPAQAVQLAIEHKPDVIMSDVNMPGMNGFELTHQLKSNDNTNNIAILLFSSIEKSGNVFRKALQAGAEDFIKMPADGDEVTARLEVCIARHNLTKALEEKVAALERFQAVTLDREKRMLELKTEVRKLKEELGK